MSSFTSSRYSIYIRSRASQGQIEGLYIIASNIICPDNSRAVRYSLLVEPLSIPIGIDDFIPLTGDFGPFNLGKWAPAWYMLELNWCLPYNM